MPLTWIEPKKPDGGKESFYDHVTAETPLGPIHLEWKSWKDHDDPGGQMPWGEYISGTNLTAAKSAVQDAWNEKVLLAMLLVENSPL